MISLSAKIRKKQGKQVKALRQKGVLPAVLYGPKIKNENLEVNLKEFEKIYKEAGESTLVTLEVEGKKKYLVLIHDLDRDPLSNAPTHIDFYQPSLEDKIEIKVPVVFEGEAEAVKNLGGTLIKNIGEIIVKALPQNLPKEIKVNVTGLKTFEDAILVENLKLAEGVEVLRNPKDIIAQVTPPEKVEEELEKPIEEKVEDVEKIEKPARQQPESEAMAGGEKEEVEGKKPAEN